ncbi:hypothetical protein GOQ27_01475 [Clostridium sp. D2Q-11]|uniref:Holin n=1 Tax=Anaeromonas frigoriresistens TaxID=2683708 RepID=A0A942Z571_9FIRM|nr:hypothetical protein [Anaeromonas frigoriresistens]MBS4537111.1 hypothetical protein [Anaeromonas frigoriresistens]
MSFEIYDISFVPIIIFLTSIILNIGIPKRFGPIISTILGIVFGIFYIEPDNLLKGILSGIFIGASAVGFYSGTKNIYQEMNPKK